MVNLRSGAHLETLETLQNVNAKENGNGSNQKVSEYELSREQRIKENFERMQKLGIFDLSLKVKSLKPTPKFTRQRRTPQTQSPPPLPPSCPVRRSSRLQNATPVSYSEVHLAKKENPQELEDHLLREEGSKPEVYTEEHEKLLGNTERIWTLFVDGFGNDGKRIYDPVKGKTCHQCRQKTLGHRTHCSQCNMVQGQFCGDCLYMRYGEHVLEANENPNWICPVCRGICNCSLCRQAKGWPPTGPLYRKILRLGYKSVAHYLIQIRRSNTQLDENLGTKVPVSAKRSLPFSDTEATAAADDLSKIACGQETDSPAEENKTDNNQNDEEVAETRSIIKHGDANVPPVDVKLKIPEVPTNSPVPKHNSANKGASVSQHENLKKEVICMKDDKIFPKSASDSLISESNNISIGVSAPEPENLKEESIICTLENKNSLAMGTGLKSHKKRVCTAEQTSDKDSIAARLKQRRGIKNANEELD